MTLQTPAMRSRSITFSCAQGPCPEMYFPHMRTTHMNVDSPICRIAMMKRNPISRTQSCT